MIRRLGSALGAALALAGPAQAHQLNVFAATDCETVTVEARFSSGRVPVLGEVRVSDGAGALVMRGALGEDGMLRFALADLDASTGLMLEVSSGGHDDYWILTPDDIARACQS